MQAGEGGRGGKRRSGWKSLLSLESHGAELPGLRCRISNVALGQRRAVFVHRGCGDGLLMRLSSSAAELTL